MVVNMAWASYRDGELNSTGSMSTVFLAGTGKEVARPERFELPTLWFEARCSIQLSYGRVPPSYQNSRAARRGAGCGVQGSAAGIRVARNRKKRYGAQNRDCRGDEQRISAGRKRGKLVGLGGLEPPTSPLSVVNSPLAVGDDELRHTAMSPCL
jgi:hypothetical protein